MRRSWRSWAIGWPRGPASRSASERAKRVPLRLVPDLVPPGELRPGAQYVLQRSVVVDRRTSRVVDDVGDHRAEEVAVSGKCDRRIWSVQGHRRLLAAGQLDGIIGRSVVLVGRYEAIEQLQVARDSGVIDDTAAGRFEDVREEEVHRTRDLQNGAALEGGALEPMSAARE